MHNLINNTNSQKLPPHFCLLTCELPDLALASPVSSTSAIEHHPKATATVNNNNNNNNLISPLILQNLSPLSAQLGIQRRCLLLYATVEVKLALPISATWQTRNSRTDRRSSYQSQRLVPACRRLYMFDHFRAVLYCRYYLL
jgi:hypothetical protein